MADQAARAQHGVDDASGDDAVTEWLRGLPPVSAVDGHCANRIESPDGTEYRLPGAGAASLPDPVSEYVQNGSGWTTKYVAPHRTNGHRRSYER
ncbi:MAG: hypothetical protein SVW02_03325 [Candidatus Nanohaloarchaea archaeon]|nr:hypothetical protein [Candidatus Nanohaloarchaea archaeon]